MDKFSSSKFSLVIWRCALKSLPQSEQWNMAVSSCCSFPLCFLKRFTSFFMVFHFMFAGGFYVRSIAAQSPNHEPEQSAADIDEPCPPRSLDDKEDDEGDDVIEENVKSHSAFVLITDAKIWRLRMCLGNVVKI